MNVFQKYPWLPLAIINVLLVVGTWLFFALGLGVGISEDHHPKSVARPLFPTVGILFIISIVFLLASLVAWCKWWTVTGKKVAITLLAYLLLMTSAGVVTFSMTEENEYMITTENRGYTYEIPRVYAPSSNRSGTMLEIGVCDEKPVEGTYGGGRSYFDRRDFPCTEVRYRISAIEQVSPSVEWSAMRDGEWGFTISTSTQGLRLIQLDQTLLTENDFTFTNKGNTGIIQSNVFDPSRVRAEYTSVIYLEIENDLLQWLTICGAGSCYNFAPIPDDPRYVIRTEAKNSFFKHTGTVENIIWKYKERSEDALALFESFKIDRSSNSAATGIPPSVYPTEPQSSLVNTQTYNLTVEGPSGTYFTVLSNEFEVGQFSSDVQFNYGRPIPLLRKSITNTVQIMTQNPAGIDINITRGDEVICDPPEGTLTCTFSATPAYTLDLYEESETQTDCADTEFLSGFFADFSPYQLFQFQRYFHVDIADLTDEVPVFIDQRDSCSKDTNLTFTHEAQFEAAYSSRDSLHKRFGLGSSVKLFFNVSDITANVSVAVGDNPPTNAHLLLSYGGESQLIKLSGGARDLHILLSETR